MKYTLLVILVAMLSSTGCMSKTYIHPTKGSQEFAMDKYECNGRATMIAGQWSGTYGIPNMFILAEEIDKCLRLKCGWRLQ